MAEDAIPESATLAECRPLWRRIARWAAIGVAVLLALVAALVVGLDTGPGKRFIAGRLAGYTTQSGINVRVARIEGSIYGHMELAGLEVRDQNGVFLTSPLVAIDWHPFAYLRSKIDLDRVMAGEVRLLRNPALKPVPEQPNAPTIPDIDLRLGHLRVDRFILEPPVTGRRHMLRIDGGAVIADRRAQLVTDTEALVAPGVAGGDRLHVRLDAVPDQDRLLVDVRLQAPAGGVVDSYFRLGKPLALTVAGRGDWHLWRGRAQAALGGQGLMDIGLAGRDGHFRALGDVRPAIMLTGVAARLTAPAVHVDAAATLDQRRADTHVRLSSAAFVAQAQGLLDFARSRFGDFHLDARLLSPGVIAPNLFGRNVAVSAVLDGAFQRPGIAYRVSADALAFGTTGVEGLVAEGQARFSTNRVIVPVHASVRRVTGLNAAAGGLVTGLRADGDIAYANGQVISDNLHLRSDRIDATALLVADLKRGTYTGALQGRVNDYQLNGLGRLNLVTDARLVTAPGGGFGIKGHVRIVTRRITNAALAGQLGGNALITADIGYDPKAGASLSNLRLTAPVFRVTAGEGDYNLSNGALRFRVDAWSRRYGPAHVIATGTLAKPTVVMKAPHPGVGIGLADLEAVLIGSPAGYQVKAKGSSDYGPFTADLLIRSSKGPLAIDVHQLLIAGISAHGSIVQTAAGPFAGTLSVAGSGLNGEVQMAAAGHNQKADVNLAANGARLPGTPPISIGSGLLRGSLVMLPNGASVSGSMALVDVRQGALLFRSARARLSYAGGHSQVALTASGSSGVPFDIAAQAALAPDRIVANARGSANGIAFRFAAPAVIAKQGRNYVLEPASIVLPQGSVDLTGRYGATRTVHAKLNGVDIGIAQAFAPWLGVSGKATGTVDLTLHGSAIPDANARVDIAGFTRTGALVVSDPVDIAMLGTLHAGGGAVNALIRRGGATIGRVQAKIGAVGGAEGLAQASLSGGIRYNGPAEVLWTLTGIGGQTVAGPVAIGADFSGRVGAPELTGVIRASQLRYENEATGTTITGIVMDGRFTSSEFQLNSFSGKAGSGTIKASGSVGFAADSGFPIAITATLDHAQLAHSDAVGATVSGSLAVTNSKAEDGLIKGDLNIQDARYRIVRTDAAQVSDLSGVRRKGVPPPSAINTNATAAGPAPSNWKLALRIHADNRIFVSGMGLESEWSTRMWIGGRVAAPTVVGRLQVVRGTYNFAGRRLDLENSSTVEFNGPLLDPDLHITADTAVEGVTATIEIVGTATHPQITFTSTPVLPQDEVLSRLLFGSSVTSLSPTQALQLAAALNSLSGTGGGVNPLGKLRGASGLDRLRVLGADQTTGRGTSLAAGKYISNRIYVEVITDAKGFTQTQLTIALSKALSLLSQAGGETGPAVTLRYSKQY